MTLRAGDASLIGCPPRWLHQVHGNAVAHIGKADLQGPAPQADAAWTGEPGVAAVVRVADCMPVLFTTSDVWAPNSNVPFAPSRSVPCALHRERVRWGSKDGD